MFTSQDASGPGDAHNAIGPAHHSSHAHNSSLEHLIGKESSHAKPNSIYNVRKTNASDKKNASDIKLDHAKANSIYNRKTSSDKKCASDMILDDKMLDDNSSWIEDSSSRKSLHPNIDIIGSSSISSYLNVNGLDHETIV